MSQRRKYLNYTTDAGVSLAKAANWGSGAFLLHESGFRPALADWNHQGVDSPFWRFYHNPKPGCHVRFRGKNLPLEPNSCLLIPADTIFDCCGPVPACHLWIHFTASQGARSGPSVPQRIEMDEVLRMLVEAVLGLHQEPPSEIRDQRLYHYSASILHAAFARAELPSPQPLPETIQEVLSLIHRAPHSHLPNALLAERAGMTVERFIRQFQMHTGTTPAAYVTSARVRQAGESLALTEKTIEQIAAETGFGNRHYFSRVFARQMGCGPAEFRTRQHGKRGR